jgi:methyl-accepting chemotaxis protein
MAACRSRGLTLTDRAAHSSAPRSSRPRQWFADLRVRSKVLLPLLVAAMAMLGLCAVGAVAVTSTAAAAQALCMRGARPLDAIGHIRDGEGDSRVAVREYVLATTVEQRAAVRTDISASDAALDNAVRAFLASDQPMPSSRATLLSQFRQGIAQWRQVRDQQVLPAAAGRGVAAAQQLISGPLQGSRR